MGLGAQTEAFEGYGEGSHLSQWVGYVRLGGTHGMQHLPGGEGSRRSNCMTLLQVMAYASTFGHTPL